MAHEVAEICKVVVEDKHFEYLSLQRGALSDLAHDRAVWHEAYERSLAKDFRSIEEHLPASCVSVLDVGGGLGGIDVLLARRFPELSVTILDGENDPPAVGLHRHTFNHMGVARDFHARNGNPRFDYFTPALADPKPFDLILSLASWCFHYPPETYLEFVTECCVPGSILIIDVRISKPDWLRSLRSRFNLRGTAMRSAKFERLVFTHD